MPALRDRPEDIPDLVAHFIERFNKKYRRRVQSCSPEAMEILTVHDWPGNVRQLEHALEHAFVVTPRGGRTILPDALPPELVGRHAAPGATNGGGGPRSSDDNRPSKRRRVSLDEQRAEVEDTLRLTEGNKAAAARLLGLTRAGLYARMRRLGIAGK